MSFNSIDFVIFFPIVVFVYFLIPQKAKNVWLLAASYYFYMCWNAEYALLILASTLITYFSAIVLERIKKKTDEPERKKRKAKAAVVWCIILNLGILFFFKYLNFARETVAAICSLFNITLNIPKVDILLPVGISFYTFQALSYTIDVYRDEIEAEKNFLKYALFVSFFPQLVAGPIERSKNLLPQLSEPQKFNYERFREGFFLMLWGFFLKLVIADKAGVFVDTVYADPETYTGYYLVVATVLFAVQIYCDFAGYSTIAVGAARILGISLTDNFDAPYLSLSISAFWKRWHISLTTWFREYLYIPIGGNRKGKRREYINKLAVFLVSGLWHGADFSFVIWGGLNGAYQVIGEATKTIRDRIVTVLGLHRNTFAHKLLQTFITFSLICFSWIFFRAASLSEAAEIIRSIFTSNNIWILFDDSLYKCGLDIKNFWAVIGAIMVLLLVDCFKRKGIAVRKIIARQDWWFRCLVVVIMICVILLFGKWGSAFNEANFIYFQF